MKTKKTTNNRKQNFNWILAGLILSGLLGISSVSLGAGDTWTEKTPMPKARDILSASTVDGKIYAIGGLGGSSVVEEYNPATDTWTKKASLPTPRQWLSTCVVNGKIYAIGGDASAGAPSLSTVEVYDPATDTWTEKAPMLISRFGLSTSAVNGKIYAFGGWRRPPLSLPRDIEEYDPATDTWTKKAPMPTARAGLSTSVVDGKIYAIGGAYSGGGAGLSKVEVYDPVTDTWTTKASMPTARAPFSSTSVVDGLIYVIGGISGQTAFSTVEAYNPATNTWTEKTSMPKARGFLATSVVGGKIYAIGGRASAHGAAMTIVEEYDTGLTVSSPDFNGDGIVDSTDISMLIDYWQTDELLYDIAPAPFGDGIVDVQDLIFLSEYLMKEVDDPTLVAHWAFDETEGIVAQDSAAINDAYIIGDPIWLPDGGMVDGAILLDGVDDSVVAGPVLNPSAGSFSVLAWVQGGVPGQTVISQVDGADWLGTDPLDGTLMTELKSSRRSGSPLLSQAVITDDNWHRIGFVWDGLNRTLYVDGEEVAQDTQKDLGGSYNGIYIGTGKAMEPGSYFSGLIDDVRIYNRAVRP